MAEWAALVQREENGEWNVYHSRWGGTNRALSAVCAGLPPSKLPVSWKYGQSVGSFTEAVAGLDYLGTELVYREQGGQRAFLVLWFGLPLGTAGVSLQAGTAVEVHSLQDTKRLRTAFRQFKNRIADALETGILPASAAPAVLVGGIHRLQGRELYVVWRSVESSDVLYAITRPGDP